MLTMFNTVNVTFAKQQYVSIACASGLMLAFSIKSKEYTVYFYI